MATRREFIAGVAALFTAPVLGSIAPVDDPPARAALRARPWISDTQTLARDEYVLGLPASAISGSVIRPDAIDVADESAIVLVQMAAPPVVMPIAIYREYKRFAVRTSAPVARFSLMGRTNSAPFLGYGVGEVCYEGDANGLDVFIADKFKFMVPVKIPKVAQRWPDWLATSGFYPARLFCKRGKITYPERADFSVFAA